MTRLRRASVLATLSLLALAATAHADCAWVLWRPQYDQQGRQLPNNRYTPVGAFDSKNKSVQSQPGDYLCLPDSVDPRGAKGK